MNWIDIASIVVICTTANHLGLVKAAEEAFARELPIVNCVKCSTFWASFFCLVCSTHAIITSLAIAFLASYAAIWLELFEGFIDTLFEKCYEKIYSTTGDNADTAEPDEGDPADALS